MLERSVTDGSDNPPQSPILKSCANHLLHCARLCSRIFDYDKSRYQVESGKEGFAQLVVAGCNAPEVFDLVEEALDKVAIAVKFLVVSGAFYSAC